MLARMGERKTRNRLGPAKVRKGDRPPAAMRPSGRVSEEIAARRRCEDKNSANNMAAR